MNQDQATHLVRMAMASGGPLGGLLIANHYATPDQTNAIADGIAALIGVVPPIAAAVWGMFEHTTSAKIAAVEMLPDSAKTAVAERLPSSVKIAAVEALPSVMSIVVAQDAPAELADIVKDASRPKIVAAPEIQRKIVQQVPVAIAQRS